MDVQLSKKIFLVASDPNDLDIVINSSADCTLLGTADVKVLGSLTSSGHLSILIFIKDLVKFSQVLVLMVG